MAQKKEIKRLEKTKEQDDREANEERGREEEEAKQRSVQEFERIQMGLEAKLGGASSRKIIGREAGKLVVEGEVVGGKRGEKRKFELDEDELLRIAREERNKARKAIDDEKVCLALMGTYISNANYRLPRPLFPHSGFLLLRLRQTPTILYIQL